MISKRLFFTALIVMLLAAGTNAADSEYLVLRWKYSTSRGVNDIGVGDLNNDGDIEIIASMSDTGEIEAVDREGERVWKYGGGCPVRGLSVGDSDGDGSPEIAAVYCNYIHLINSEGTDEWKFMTTLGSKGPVVFEDMNNDGYDDIVAGSGNQESKRNNVILIINNDGERLGRYGVEYAPSAMDFADFNGDGFKDIVIGSEGPRRQFGDVYLMNNSGKLIRSEHLRYGIDDVEISDLDKDGENEILVGRYQTFSVFDSEFEAKWSYGVEGHTYSIVVADIDGDKEDDIILGAANVYVLDNRGKLKWEYDVSAEVTEIALGDLDKDGTPELIVGSDVLYVFDSAGKKLWNSLDSLAVRGIEIIDIDGDGFNEVVAGTISRENNIQRGGIEVYDTEIPVLRGMAESYINSAKSAYRNGNFENATRFYQMARDAYQRLGDVANANVCTAEIKNVAERAEVVGSDEAIASDYYNKSQEYYIEGDFTNALIFADLARRKYHGLGYDDKKNACVAFIEKVETGLNLDAYESMLSAENYTLLEDWSNALDYGLRAKEAYFLLESEEDAIEATRIVSDGYLEVAKEQTKDKDYQNASESVQKARYLYLCLYEVSQGGSIFECNESGIELVAPSKLLDVTKTKINATDNETEYADRIAECDELMARIQDKATSLGIFGGLKAFVSGIADKAGDANAFVILEVTVIIALIGVAVILVKKGVIRTDAVKDVDLHVPKANLDLEAAKGIVLPPLAKIKKALKRSEKKEKEQSEPEEKPQVEEENDFVPEFVDDALAEIEEEEKAKRKRREIRKMKKDNVCGTGVSITQCMKKKRKKKHRCTIIPQDFYRLS